MHMTCGAVAQLESTPLSLGCEMLLQNNDNTIDSNIIKH